MPLGCLTGPRIGTRFTLSIPNSPITAVTSVLVGACRSSPEQLVAPSLCELVYLWAVAQYATANQSSPPVFEIDIPNDAQLVGVELCAQAAYPVQNRNVPFPLVECWRATDAIRFRILGP